MKRVSLIAVCCLLFAVGGWAQFSDHRKTLLDSEFVVKDVVRIPTILYDLNKATIRPESMDSLKLVFDFLQLYPFLAVEISVHTDSRSDDPKSDTRLTLRRAQVCRDSLIKLGIDSTRLTAVGYGSARPMVPETLIKKLESKVEKEKAYALNRRTELKIVSVSFH